MRKDITQKKSFWLGLGLAMAAFYVCAALLEGCRIYPDSQSYLEMDLSREPLYSLFLALMRLLFGWGGEPFFLRSTVIVQSLITAWAGWYFVRRCRELFALRLPGTLGLAGCTLLPSLLSRFFAVRRAMYSYSLITESLAFPLYLVFFTFLAAWVLRGRRRDFALAAVLAFLLISLRKQMYVTLPLLLLGALWRGIRQGKLLRRLAAGVLAAALVLLANSLLDRGTNYLVHGAALRHTGDMRFVTTMLLYTAEPEDAAAIGDQELRGLFEQILDKADREQLTRRYAPADWFGRSLFFMNHYDLIQFGCLLLRLLCNRFFFVIFMDAPAAHGCGQLRHGAGQHRGGDEAAADSGDGAAVSDASRAAGTLHPEEAGGCGGLRGLCPAVDPGQRGAGVADDLLPAPLYAL